MGVGVDAEWNTEFHCLLCHMAVRKGMPLPRRYLKRYAFFLAKRRSSSDMIPGCARMSALASIAARFVPGRTGSTRVSPWTTTILCTQLPGFLYKVRYHPGWSMGDLCTGDCFYRYMVFDSFQGMDYLRDHQVYI